MLLGLRMLSLKNNLWFTVLDEVEARYILSPSFMEQIMAFKNKTNAKIQFSFVGNNIYMAMPMKENLFEPSLRKTVMNFEDIKSYYSQLQFCVSIVDALNLNTRVWTKQ